MVTSIDVPEDLYRNPPYIAYALNKSENVTDHRLNIPNSPPLSGSPDERLLAKLKAQLGKLREARMNLEMETVFNKLRNEFSRDTGKFNSCAPFEVVIADDGSLLVEWQFADRKLGFNIEPNEGDSGWYYVFSRSSGGEMAAGPLATMDIEALIRRMLP